MASPPDVISLRLPVLLFLLALLLHEANASVVRDWCPAKNASQGSDDALNGLEGKTIKCGAAIWPPFSTFNESTGEWSGYDIEVFREVARRGRFNVEIVGLKSPAQNETWEDVLNTQGRELDIMCTWWGEALSRKRRGFAFSYPILDQSLIIATPIPRRVEQSFAQQFWVFLQPFSRDLWLTLLFGNLFTAIVIFIVDPNINLDPWTNAKDTRRKSETHYPTSGGVLDWCKYALINISGFFYQGWVLATVQDPYKHPRNFWMKIYLMSWTGVLIVLIAAYTAQLTSFLFTDSRPVDSIDNFEQVVDGNIPVCSVGDSVQHIKQFFLNVAPSVPVFQIDTVDQAFPGIRQGDCRAALASKAELELLIAGNEECDMRIVGRTLKDLNGVYPGDTSNCGDFVVHVVGGLVQQMAQEGLIEDMWTTYVTQPAKCAWLQNEPSKAETKTPLPLKTLGGLFIIHAAFAFLAIVGLRVQKFLQKKDVIRKNDSFFDDSLRGIQAGPWQKIADSFKIPKSSNSQVDVKQLTKDVPSFGRTSTGLTLEDSGCDLPPGASAGQLFLGGGKNFAEVLRGKDDEGKPQERPAVPHLDLGFAKGKFSREDGPKPPTPPPPELSSYVQAGSASQVPLKSSMAKHPDDASTPRSVKRAALVTPHETVGPDAAQKALQARLEQRSSAQVVGSPRSGLNLSPAVTARNVVLDTDDLIKLQDGMSRAHSFSSLAAGGPPKQNLGSSGGSQDLGSSTSLASKEGEGLLPSSSVPGPAQHPPTSLGQASFHELIGIELRRAATRSRLSATALADLVLPTEEQQQQQQEPGEPPAELSTPRASAALGPDPDKVLAADGVADMDDDSSSSSSSS